MPIIALLVIAIVSLFVVRIGATALMMTGLSRSVAEFQAVSCFFGVGYTTAEAEMVATHPVRRRIATHLIILGNLGITGALGALIVTLLQSDTDWLDRVLGLQQHSTGVRVLAIGTILAAVFLIYRLGFVRAVIESTVRYTLERAGVVRALDYETILRAREGYVISEFEIDPGHPFIGKSLEALALGKQGVLVLGVLHDSGDFEPTPTRLTTIEQGDVLTVYGEENLLREVLHAGGVVNS